eukprot:11199997-Lingulodinium_polyedra.AAC.1
MGFPMTHIDPEFFVHREIPGGRLGRGRSAYDDHEKMGEAVLASSRKKDTKDLQSVFDIAEYLSEKGDKQENEDSTR